MPDKCLDCPVPSADMDGFIVSGPGGAPRSEGSGVSSPEGPFVREAPRTGHVVIMGTLGADGNPGSLPDAPQVGWAYVAGDAGEYGGVTATEGDMVYCMSLNPTRWGVLQADSDDSGRDLVSVSASFGCDPSPALSLTSAKASGASSVQTVDMSCLSSMYGRLDSVAASFECASMDSYAPYGSVAEIAVYDSGMNVLGRSNSISAPGGLLEVPPLQDVSWRLQDPDFSAIAFVSVRFTSAEHANDAFSVYKAMVSPASWEALSSGDVLICETSCSVRCLGPERCELEVVSAPASGSRTFQIRASAGPVLFSLASTSASGETSVQEVDMSCLVPPVFDGSVNGLVPASGAVQNYLLAGNGSWMRPMTDAEIDALFVESEPE